MWIVAKSLFWTSLGIFLFRGQFITAKTPKLLGKILYWLGVPLQILVLTRRSDFSQIVWLSPVVAIAILLIGLSLAWLCLQIPKKVGYHLCDRSLKWQQWREWEYFSLGFAMPPQLSVFGNVIDGNTHYFSLIPFNFLSHSSLSDFWSSNRISQPQERLFSTILKFSFTCHKRASKASFILASMLGNTGFIGLAIAPALIDSSYWSWIVIYGVAHSIFGSYGLGVILANYYSNSAQAKNWQQQLHHILLIPSLWAFLLGWLTKDISFPSNLESALQNATLFIIPGAFLLIGMQLSTIDKIESCYTALFSTAIKISILPLLTGLGLTLLGIDGDARLALVLMSGMPTAFANAILAEEYNLDRQIATSSILLSTIVFPLILPLWLILF
ncbi:MAG: hypothetical protein Tsb0014_13000 [Pleurocapsa sp.]